MLRIAIKKCIMAAEMNGQWFIMLPPLAVGVFSLRLLNGGFSFKTGPCLLCEVEPLPEDKSGAEAKILYSKSSENSHFPPPKKKEVNHLPTSNQ